MHILLQWSFTICELEALKSVLNSLKFCKPFPLWFC